MSPANDSRDLGWLVPDWPAPPGVRAVSTTRRGGVSAAPYDDFNLAAHVGDAPSAVAANRARLRECLGLPAEPCWLQQVHGVQAVPAVSGTPPPEADAGYTDRPGVVCAVLTADCLPILLCDRAGRRIAAIHAGWRGLANGVIERALDCAGPAAGGWLAWLGPAIGPGVFEVGAEVRDAFVTGHAAATEAFQPSPAGRWLADLYVLARQRLAGCGVTDVYGGGACTYSDRERFFSYRRDGATGRMATLVWLAGQGTP
jgi:YfiH family protein